VFFGEIQEQLLPMMRISRIKIVRLEQITDEPPFWLIAERRQRLWVTAEQRIRFYGRKARRQRYDAWNPDAVEIARPSDQPGGDAGEPCRTSRALHEFPVN
jgi:hypothetical protein